MCSILWVFMGDLYVFAKNVYSLIVRCRVLYMVIRLSFLIVLFIFSIALLLFVCLFVSYWEENVKNLSLCFIKEVCIPRWHSWVLPAFVFDWVDVLVCRPGWSVVAWSRLTATSASQVQVILLPQPP